MSTSNAILIAGCAVITAILKAAGPVALGGRDLPVAFRSVILLLGPALFAALVATQVLADGKDIGIGPETAGVAAGGLVVWRTGSILGCVLTAAIVTALLRAL
jgi:branched-subunit amino acid transport protein